MDRSYASRRESIAYAFRQSERSRADCCVQRRPRAGIQTIPVRPTRFNTCRALKTDGTGKILSAKDYFNFFPRSNASERRPKMSGTATSSIPVFSQQNRQREFFTTPWTIQFSPRKKNGCAERNMYDQDAVLCSRRASITVNFKLRSRPIVAIEENAVFAPNFANAIASAGQPRSGSK